MISGSLREKEVEQDDWVVIAETVELEALCKTTFFKIRINLSQVTSY